MTHHKGCSRIAIQLRRGPDRAPAGRRHSGFRRFPRLASPFLSLLTLSLASALATDLIGCSHNGSVTEPPDVVETRRIPQELQDDVDQIVAGNTAFALDFYAQTLEGSPDLGNLVTSPYSVSTALAMTWAGARTHTESEMRTVLRFPFDQDRLHPAFGALQGSLDRGTTLGGYRLSVGNRLWGQEGYSWLEPFLRVTREHYGAELEELDFVHATEAARETINLWVDDKTVGKIPELIPEGVLSPLTTLVLTNAIYFKGNWAKPFDEEGTEPSTFYTDLGEEVEVPMMSQHGEFGYAKLDGFRILELAYEGEDLSLILLLPEERTGSGEGSLAALETHLGTGPLETWLGAIEVVEIDVWLPRFTFRSKLVLNDVLTNMGMSSAFGNAPGADLSGMDGTRSLFISKVIHEAFIQVNEEGTEAAGATAVVIDRTGGGDEPYFRADHPFLFLIWDRLTRSVLFLGRVTDPSA